MLTSNALAQEDVLRPSIAPPIKYGVEVGANYNIFAQDIARSVPVPNSPYDAYASGSGVSPYGFIYADYSINKSFGVMVKAGLDTKSFGNSMIGTGDCHSINGTQTEFTSLSERLDYKVTTTFVTLGAIGRFTVGSRLNMSFGPLLQVRLDSTNQIEEREFITDGPCEFLDVNGNGIGKTLIEEKKIESNPSTRIGFEGGIGYRFTINRQFDLIPTLRMQYMITEYIEDRPSADQYQRFSVGVADVDLTNTSLHSVQLGVALQFGL